MTKLGRRGRITIPKHVREALNLRPGDRITFEAEDGRLVGRVQKPESVMDLYRRLPGVPPGDIDLEAETRAFAEAAVENEKRLASQLQ
ncbi:MAG: AbrB/MazE/SpoVT family DNA-binding domain-containing protein [Trueperaceae bacterium]|nr:AbrB/MazE/SpoVT family DNA-binding domain-containing protein [Trueperaceae bacterium]